MRKIIQNIILVIIPVVHAISIVLAKKATFHVKNTVTVISIVSFLYVLFYCIRTNLWYYFKGPRRFPGCNCYGFGKTCSNRGCICFTNYRECDPDLCGCTASGVVLIIRSLTEGLSY